MLKVSSAVMAAERPTAGRQSSVEWWRNTAGTLPDNPEAARLQKKNLSIDTIPAKWK